MLSSKKLTLRPLLESEDGVHFTAYLRNRGDLLDLKSQLQSAIDQSYEWLNPVMEADERNRFLEPLDSLVNDSKILRRIKGNVGIFRNKNLFRVLNIPVSVEPSCQVASSFHVKPLLKWLQSDQDFLLLGLEPEAVHLYLGSQDTFKLVASAALLDPARLDQWVAQLTRGAKPKMFLAGARLQVAAAKLSLKYRNLVKAPVADTFSADELAGICSDIRRLLKRDSAKLIEKSVLEFRFAEDDRRTRKNIFQIAKAVVRGKVRKLIVTDELNIFGKIDKKTGGLAIHPYDMDHEDDDILDDLAQMVLNQGGEVVVAPRAEIPGGRPILAILEGEDVELDPPGASAQLEILQERFG